MTLTRLSFFRQIGKLLQAQALSSSIFHCDKTAALICLCTTWRVQESTRTIQFRHHVAVIAVATIPSLDYCFVSRLVLDNAPWSCQLVWSGCESIGHAFRRLKFSILEPKPGPEVGLEAIWPKKKGLVNVKAQVVCPALSLSPRFSLGVISCCNLCFSYYCAYVTAAAELRPHIGVHRRQSMGNPYPFFILWQSTPDRLFATLNFCRSFDHIEIIFGVSVQSLYIRIGRFSFSNIITLLHQNMSMRSPHTQNDDDIQGMDDSNNPQVPDNIHHIQNLIYEVYINSFNTHKFRMQDSGNNNNRWSLSCCSSIVSDEARPFISSTLTVATSATAPWPTSLAKFYFQANCIGADVLHRDIFVDHGFHLPYVICHSCAYWALVKHINHSYWSINSYLLLLAIICNYFSSP